MALRHVGGPAFPLGIQIGQRVDGRDARSQGIVGPRQQLRPPGRDAGPRVQQRHVGFPPVERRVQDRQVGDLQGDDHQAGSGGDEHDRRGCRAGRNREPEGEHRGPGDGEGRRNAALLERPQQQHVPEEGDRQPGDQLREQGRRGLGREHQVTPLMLMDGAGYQLEHPVHAPVRPPCQPAADRAGHDQGPDDAGPRREHERQADGGGHPAASERDHHGVLLGRSGAMPNLLRPARPRDPEAADRRPERTSPREDRSHGCLRAGGGARAPPSASAAGQDKKGKTAGR